MLWCNFICRLFERVGFGGSCFRFIYLSGTMRSPGKTIGWGRSHKGFSGLKKYSIETRLRALEDLRTGVDMDVILETHEINSRR